MANETRVIRENAASILFAWNDYNNLPSNLVNSADAAWHKIVTDIYLNEAPKTLTKLILELNLVDAPYLVFRNYNDNEVEVLSILRSIDENPVLWDDAFSKSRMRERVKSLIEQSTFQVSEIHRALINIKVD